MSNSHNVRSRDTALRISSDCSTINVDLDTDAVVVTLQTRSFQDLQSTEVSPLPLLSPFAFVLTCIGYPVLLFPYFFLICRTIFRHRAFSPAVAAPLVFPARVLSL